MTWESFATKISVSSISQIYDWDVYILGEHKDESRLASQYLFGVYMPQSYVLRRYVECEEQHPMEEVVCHVCQLASNA